MKKKIGIYSLIIVLIIIGCVYSVKIGQTKEVSYFEDKEVQYAVGEQIAYQEKVDTMLQEYMQDKNYTMENPKIVVNPYGLTPLTAIIIFQTEESTPIQVNINGTYFTTVEESSLHSIPIYGMYAGKENCIQLTDKNNHSKEYYITTEAYEGDLLKVETTSEKLDNSVYFLSPNFVENCIYDKQGNLLWYIQGAYAGDIEYLENGHFFISDPYQGTNGVKINYAGFLEMDYLGKIYKQYVTPYGYHHEIVQLGNEEVLLLGSDDNSDFLEAILYTMNLETGEVGKKIDMYALLHATAPEWVESLGSDFDFVLNSAYYDEETGDVILSCRGIGVIMRMNLETEEIKWMFGDPENLPEEWDTYLLTVTDDTQYPYGEHSAFLTEEGYLAFHNNNIDQLHLKSQQLSDYLENYTTNVMLAIDEQNKTIKTIWEYNANKEEFSKVGGYLAFLENGNTLTNYGWSIKQEAYENPNNISLEDTEYLNGVIVELDKNNQVLFRATLSGLIYRVYKVNLYEKTMENYACTHYEKIDATQDCHMETKPTEIAIKEIEGKLKNAQEISCGFEVQVNRVMLDLPLEIEDAVNVIFISEEGKGYVYTYKNAGEEVRQAFNSQQYGKMISMPKGSYAVYIQVNHTYYNTNVIEKF